MKSPHGVMWSALGIMFCAGFVSWAITDGLPSLDMKSEVPAAWLQAFGGLGSLAAAVWIALQERSARLREERAKAKQARADRRGHMGAIIAVADEALEMARFIRGNLEKGGQESVRPLLESWADMTRDLISVLDLLLERTTDAELLMRLVRFKRLLTKTPKPDVDKVTACRLMDKELAGMLSAFGGIEDYAGRHPVLSAQELAEEADLRTRSKPHRGRSRRSQVR